MIAIGSKSIYVGKTEGQTESEIILMLIHISEEHDLVQKRFLKKLVKIEEITVK